MKNKEENNEIICFECRKPGHMKGEFPLMKKKRNSEDRKKKSLMVTWDDSDNEKSSSSGDEQANICLMEDTYDKVEVKTFFESDSSSCTSLDDEEDMPYMIFFLRTVIWFLFNVKSLEKISKLMLLKALN